MDTKKTSKRSMYWDAHGEFDKKFQKTTELMYKLTGYRGIYSRVDIFSILMDDFLARNGGETVTKQEAENEKDI